MMCTTRVSATRQHPACLCPSLPHISTGKCFPLSESSRTSAAALGIQTDHTTQSSRPVAPAASRLQQLQYCQRPFLTEPLALTACLSTDGGNARNQFAFWEQKGSHSQLSNFCKEESLFIPSLPFPKSIFSLPFPTYNGVNKRHIYSAWLGTKFKLQVSAVQQPQAEMSALKHHKHFKAERKNIWRVFHQKMELSEIKHFPIFKLTSQNTKN